MRLGIELGLEVGQLRSAHPGTRRVAALRHEPVDHAVEHHAVVESFARQLRDAIDMARREVGTQPDDDIAAVAVAGVESEGERFGGHGKLLMGSSLGECRAP